MLPNRHGVFLDLCFTHCSEINVVSADDPLLPESHHHVAYNFLISCGNNGSLKYEVYYHDFRNADFFQLNYYLSTVNWNDILSGDDIDNALEKFYDVMYTAVNLFVPVKRFRSSNFSSWFSPYLKKLTINKKNSS